MKDHDLDAILALQFTVAWAGETGRLGWWQTDLCDPDGGGDFLRRLAPQMAAWAGLKLVREAARRVDERARRQIAGGDGALTLFHFGYDIDEQLTDQLDEHRRKQHVPAEVLGPTFLAGAPWSLERLAQALAMEPARRRAHCRGALHACAAPPDSRASADDPHVSPKACDHRPGNQRERTAVVPVEARGTMIKFFLRILWARLRCLLLGHVPAPARMVDALGRWDIRCARCGANQKEILR